MKLGVVAFIVPFVFVYQPALLLRGSVPEVVIAAVTSTFGVVILAAGLEGWLLSRMAGWERLLSVVGAFPSIKPGICSDLAGLACAAILAVRQHRKRGQALLPSRSDDGVPPSIGG